MYISGIKTIDRVQDPFRLYLYTSGVGIQAMPTFYINNLLCVTLK